MPEVDPVSGVLVVTHDDDPHKKKLIVNHLRSQLVELRKQQTGKGGRDRSAAAKGLRSDGLLISAERIQAAAGDDPSLAELVPLLLASTGMRLRLGWG